MGSFLFLLSCFSRSSSAVSSKHGIIPDRWNLILSDRGDIHNFVDVLCSMNGGHLSLHVHGDVCHLVNVLHPRYFNHLLYVSNGGNLSLMRQISSLLHVMRVLCGFKPLFFSPPILVRLVPGMDLVSVSNFKRGPELLDGFLCNLNCWNLHLCIT